MGKNLELIKLLSGFQFFNSVRGLYSIIYGTCRPYILGNKWVSDRNFAPQKPNINVAPVSDLLQIIVDDEESSIFF